MAVAVAVAAADLVEVPAVAAPVAVVDSAAVVPVAEPELERVPALPRGNRGAATAGTNAAANNAAATATTTAVAATSRNNLLAYNDVDTTITGSSGLTLRGMSPAWTQVRLDGIEIPRAFHDGAIRSSVVPGILDGATLYTGNYPTEYGGSIGGLVALSTVRDQAKTTTGYVDGNLADVSGVVRVPIIADKLTISAGGQYSYLDKTLLWAVPRRSDVAIAWVPAYQDGSLHVVWDPSKIVHVSALAYTSRDREIDVYANANNPTLSEPQPGSLVQDAQTYRGIVTAEVTPMPELVAKATVGLGQDIYVQPQPALHVQMQRAEERPSVTWTPLKTLAVTLGGEIVAEKATGHVLRRGRADQRRDLQSAEHVGHARRARRALGRRLSARRLDGAENRRAPARHSPRDVFADR